jgi:dienelactone hydrolase
MSRVVLFSLALFAFVSLLRAAPAAPATQPDAVPDDRRLTESHDVDHPVIFVPQFKDRAEWEKRAKQLREQVLVAEGLWPLPPKTPLNAVIHGKIDRDDYTIEKVFFASYPGHYVSGNLYRPKNRTGKLPAVLCPHGHWANGRFYERTDAEANKQIKGGGESTMEGAKYPIQARCAMLAKMGCIVFQYDMVGYADSTAIEHRTGFTDAESILRLQSFMGLQSWNTIRTLDFIETLPDVDPTRIAVTGASGGGTQTIIIAAIDDRPAVAFPAVMVSEAMQGGCICENAPLLRVGTNNVELIATFAPKPLGMSAANDWTAALETDGLPKLKTIYGLFGAQDDVMGKHFSFEHNYNQVSRELMYNWFNQHLKLGLPTPVKEQPWKPVPPKELSVYDEQHPRPADTADATTLRKYMAKTSDDQLDELYKNNLSEYCRIVRTALGVMVNDNLPAAGDVVVGHSSGPLTNDGTLMESGTLSRRDAGESVPFVSLIPRDWAGDVVIWVHPDGKSSLFDEAGSKNVRRILAEKSAVICADLFLTGEYARKRSAPPMLAIDGYSKQKYAGFLYAYNRGILGNQVHDLLTEISFARGWKNTRRVSLIAFAKSGPAAFLARALSGNAIDRCFIDLDGFDFDRVTDGHDPPMIPGALKYNGVAGLIPLCDTGRIVLHGYGGLRDRSSSNVSLHTESLKVGVVLDLLLAPG